LSVRKQDWFKQSNKLRRTLRRLEPEIVSGVKKEVKNAAEHIHFDAIANAYSAGLVDEGDMVASIAIKYGRDGLTAVIGPGASAININKSPFNTALYRSDKSKFLAYQFFKGYWAELGTKGSAAKNIPAQPATPFMQPAFDANKEAYSRAIGKAINNALKAATNESNHDLGPRAI
jgi:hypothetical protein